MPLGLFLTKTLAIDVPNVLYRRRDVDGKMLAITPQNAGDHNASSRRTGHNCSVTSYGGQRQSSLVDPLSHLRHIIYRKFPLDRSK